MHKWKSFIKFEKFLAIISLNVLSALFSLIFLGLTHARVGLLDDTLSFVHFSYYFFSFCFSDWIILIVPSLSSLILLSSCLFLLLNILYVFFSVQLLYFLAPELLSGSIFYNLYLFTDILILFICYFTVLVIFHGFL